LWWCPPSPLARSVLKVRRFMELGGPKWAADGGHCCSGMGMGYQVADWMATRLNPNRHHGIDTAGDFSLPNHLIPWTFCRSDSEICAWLISVLEIQL
jgi:hypothetical protein